MSCLKLPLLLLLLGACNLPNSNQHFALEADQLKDSIVPYPITILADLPDSLRSKPRFLSEFKDPKVVPLRKKEVNETRENEAKPVLNARSGGFHFTHFNSKNSILNDRIITAFCDRAGNLWLGTDGGGIFRYDGNSFSNFGTQHGLSDIIITHIAEDHNGTMWFGTMSGGLIAYDGVSFRSFTTTDGLADNYISKITVDKNGSVWIKHFETQFISTYQDGQFRTLHKDSGHIESNVQFINTDSKGNVWLAMWGNASRYDGKRFINYFVDQGLVGKLVSTIQEDLQGNIWLGTYNAGLSRYRADRLDHPCFLNTCQHDLGNPEVTEQHNGEIAKGFTSFTIKSGLGDDRIKAIEIDAFGNPWIFTEGRKISRYNWQEANTACELEHCQHDLNDPAQLHEHRAEISKAFTTFTPESGVPNDIKFIKPDSKGNVWLATKGHGMVLYEPHFANRQCELGRCQHHLNIESEFQEHNAEIAKAFTPISPSEGLVGSTVYKVLEDKDANIWIGTYDNGLSRFDGKALKSYTVDHGLLDNRVEAIIEDSSGTLWLCTPKGVILFNGKHFESYTAEDGMVNSRARAILKDRNGDLWMTHDYSVTKFDGSNFSFYSDHGINVYGGIISVNQDKEGNIWFGTISGGATRFDGKSYTQVSTRQGLAGTDVASIEVDRDGVIWFGTFDGLSRYDGRCIINFSIDHGLASNIIQSMGEDSEGNLWIGTVNGINMLSAELKAKLLDLSELSSTAIEKLGPLFTSLNINDGLPDLNIHSILADSVGKVYVGTGSGLCVLGKSGEAWKVKKVYNRATGYPINVVGSLYKDSKGIIWMGNPFRTDGVYRLDPKLVENDDAPPLMRIEKVSLNESGTCWYDLKPSVVGHRADLRQILNQQEMLSFGVTLSSDERDSLRIKYKGVDFDSIVPFYQVPINLRLPFNHNQLRIHFHAIETDGNSSIRYQYMLEGFDEEWSGPSQERAAFYGNLSPGNYTFKVRARNDEGPWSEPAVFYFQVIPPWWATWWAYALFIVTGLGVLIAIIKWRERTLIQEKRKLERIVEMRTAEVVAEKNEVEKQRQISEELLLNILPEEVAEELKSNGSARARQFDEVTVLFTDFKGFTSIAEKMKPSELVDELNIHFKKFDEITSKYNIEKIKTIGDSYMCVGGLPRLSPSHAVDVVKAGIEIQQFVQEHSEKRKKQSKDQLQIRIGIHSGPVVAGIVGIKKYAYDIWGDTVNTASRMESSGEPGRVNISQATYELIKDNPQFVFEHRGKVEAKGKGEVDMYFVSLKQQ